MVPRVLALKLDGTVIYIRRITLLSFHLEDLESFYERIAQLAELIASIREFEKLHL